MIAWLSIQNFAIASELELEFDSGFSAVTGETGSGKSLMVDALAILLGARADMSLIRHGREHAEIQCQFSLPPNHSVHAWLRANEFDCEEEILLRRVIRRDRPGRGYINGRSVNISVLRELGNELADIHGQLEHQSLMRRSVQQSLLDDSADNALLLTTVAQHYDQIRELERQRRELDMAEAQSRERADLLAFQLGELERLAPVPGEWARLDSAQKRLQHLSELASGTSNVVNRLYQDDGDNLNGELVRLAGQLRQLERFDAGLGASAALLEEAAVNLEEAALDLNSRYHDVDVDQAEVDRVENRVAAYHELSRKHRIDPDDLASLLESMQAELEGLSNPEAEADRLDQLITESRASYATAAGKLSRARRKTAKVMGKKITAAMQDLGMQGGAFDVHLESLEKGRLSRGGLETVEFRVTANPGQPLQPLARVASGGEMSRISLAIQVILAGAARVPTLIFDEVDVGIGGTVANIIGSRLKQLGRSSQVICVTHLAQVAARADHHYSVSKASGHGSAELVEVTVNKLGHEQRIEEIARMTGNEKLTRQARDHAEQMLTTG